MDCLACLPNCRGSITVFFFFLKIFVFIRRCNFWTCRCGARLTIWRWSAGWALGWERNEGWPWGWPCPNRFSIQLSGTSPVIFSRPEGSSFIVSLWQNCYRTLVYKLHLSVQVLVCSSQNVSFLWLVACGMLEETFSISLTSFLTWKAHCCEKWGQDCLEPLNTEV